ncbi:Uncharacterised protein [uncultured archaeon]|nr:Uncharacterised protein [uncultured archaeon]
MDLDAQRQQWSFQNSEYTIPLAPLYLSLYHVFRHSSAWARKQSWNQDTPRDRDYGDELSAKEKATEAQSKNLQRDAQARGQPAYQCPIHGINISTPANCPICRSQDALVQEREARSLESKIGRKAENFKSWAISAISIGENTPIDFNNYMHYQDQAHSQTGMGYRRGGISPDTAQAVMESGGAAASSMQKALDIVHKYEKYEKELVRMRGMDERIKGQKLLEMQEQREREIEELRLGIQRDRRMGFHATRLSLKAEQERIKKMEAERGSGRIE